MIRLSFFILCFLLGLLSVTAAVSGELRGLVKEAGTDSPIAGIIVKSQSSFTTTDKGGNFTLAVSADADSVSFRCMGYEPLVLAADADMLQVYLVPKVTQLNDVIVEVPDIYARGDTLVFNVERYADAADNAIIDVIKRLPGIKVEDDGTIKYQGKPINKFYLDGNDFIGGRYGLATENISHKDVKSVEVMENHQPVKALEGIEFPEEAGINLKLKDDARSRWVGVARASVGTQPGLAGNGSVFGMRMAPKVQNMFTLKADNTGWNPAAEISDHDFGEMLSSDCAETLWPEYISADIVSIPVAEKRSRDNISGLADAITAWKSGDTSMRLKLDYIGERLDYATESVTDYFSTQIPTNIQKNAMRTRSHEISAQFGSETNRRDWYLKDEFVLSGAWDRSNSAITGSSKLDQLVNRRNFSATNGLKLVRRSERRLVTLFSRNVFSHRRDALGVESELRQALQRLDATDFRSTTETRLGRMTRFWKYYVTAGLDINFHRLESSLKGIPQSGNSGHTDAFLSDLYAIPQVDYERGDWRASFRLPLKWVHHSVSGHHNYADVSPLISLHRSLGAKSRLSATAAYHLGSPQSWLWLGMPVMTDYRDIFIASVPGKYSRDVSCSLSYRYRNPLKALFANVSASWSRRKSQSMPSQLFAGDMIITTYAIHPYGSDTWSIGGGFSKGIGHSRMVAGVELNASVSASASMRDDAVIPYRQAVARVKPYFKGSIVPWLSAAYEADYGFSNFRIDGQTSYWHSFRQNLSLTIIPGDNVQFVFGAEHYLTRSDDEGTGAGLVLLDASAVWRPHDKVRLALTADNLLDRRDYSDVSWGALSRTCRHFRLRPRTVLVSIQYRF